MDQETQKKRRKLQGIVVSDKMAKTAIVAIEHFKKHPRYLKYYKVTKRLAAHDENKEFKTGDKVTIEESRPLSRTKRWKIVGRV